MLRPQPVAGVAEPSSRSLERLAHLISNVLSPPILACPVLAMGIRLSDQPGTWRYAAIYLLVAVVAPVIDLVWLMRTGRITDLHLARRQDRTHPFIVSIVCTFLALALLKWMDAPAIFLAIIRATLLQTLILFGITLAWQVSIHAATVASVATLALLVFQLSALFVLLLVPIVGWARIYLRRHTVMQVVVGTLIGAGTLIYTMYPFLVGSP